MNQKILISSNSSCLTCTYCYQAEGQISTSPDKSRQGQGHARLREGTLSQSSAFTSRRLNLANYRHQPTVYSQHTRATWCVLSQQHSLHTFCSCERQLSSTTQQWRQQSSSLQQRHTSQLHSQLCNSISIQTCTPHTHTHTRTGRDPQWPTLLPRVCEEKSKTETGTFRGLRRRFAEQGCD